MSSTAWAVLGLATTVVACWFLTLVLRVGRTLKETGEWARYQEALCVLADERNWIPDGGLPEHPLMFGHFQPWEIAQRALADKDRDEAELRALRMQYAARPVEEGPYPCARHLDSSNFNEMVDCPDCGPPNAFEWERRPMPCPRHRFSSSLHEMSECPDCAYELPECDECDRPYPT